ncbi:MAG: hypothetical protein HQK77_19860, partial [Desulfobacterales bacterium]|nr:hypothetical protein [Desulfobacterales bacterium]
MKLPFEKDKNGFSHEKIQYKLEELEIAHIELKIQNDELLTVQQLLTESRDNYLDLYEISPVGYFNLDKHGKIHEVNLGGALILGVDRDVLTQSYFRRYISPEYKNIFFYHWKAVLKTNAKQICEIKLINKQHFTVHAQLVSMPFQLKHQKTSDILCVVINITKRKIALELLEIINQSTEQHQTFHHILALLKAYRNYEAVGIRFKLNGTLPYYESIGIPFDCTECTTSYQEGMESYSCLCYRIFTQTIPRQSPCFTENGSFWTNNMQEYIDSLDTKPQLPFHQKTCNLVNYQSIALIPIRAKDQMLGIFQLSDKKSNILTLETVQFFESLCISIGIAYQRFQQENELRQLKESLEKQVEDRTQALNNSVKSLQESELGFRKLVEYSPIGIAILNKTRCIFYNRVVDRIFRNMSEKIPSILSFHCQEMVHPDDQEKISQIQHFL